MVDAWLVREDDETSRTDADQLPAGDVTLRVDFADAIETSEIRNGWLWHASATQPPVPTGSLKKQTGVGVRAMILENEKGGSEAAFP